MYTEYGYGVPGSGHIVWCPRSIAETIVKHNDEYTMYARDISDVRVVSVR